MLVHVAAKQRQLAFARQVALQAIEFLAEVGDVLEVFEVREVARTL